MFRDDQDTQDKQATQNRDVRQCEWRTLKDYERQDSVCPTVMIRSPRSRCPKSCGKIEDPVTSMESHCEKVFLFEYGGVKVFGWE